MFDYIYKIDQCRLSDVFRAVIPKWHGPQLKRALEHVAGYSIFNDASIRDYQFKSPQWTAGKNFDGTGAFGPAFVTFSKLPDGARGLMLQTKLNGQVVQKASTADMLFDVVSLIAIISEVMTFEVGDMIVSGLHLGLVLRGSLRYSCVAAMSARWK